MIRLLPLALALLLPVPADADQDAKTLAQDILTKGAAIFDTRDAAAMAATYAENAEAIMYIKDDSTGSFKAEAARGRADIEKGYAKLFQDLAKDFPSPTHSRNTVEAAHFIGPDFLAIHGTFNIDTTKDIAVPFIQVRIKQGDAWRILHLQVFGVSEK